jgi:hypothetical protein
LQQALFQHLPYQAIMPIKQYEFTTLVQGVEIIELTAHPVHQDMVIDDSASLERLRIDSSGDILKGGTLPVPAIINRQGGNAFLWENAGTTNYSPNTTTKTMIGTNSWNGTAASSGFTTINLPVGFSGTPLAFITPRSPKIVMYLQSASPTSIQFNWVTTDGSTTTGFGYQWLAIGP